MAWTLSCRLLVGLLATLSACALGTRCNVPNRPAPILAAARLTTASTVVPPLTPFDVDVQVRSKIPVHAFELAVAWDPARLASSSVSPHAEFDDDAQLLVPPRLERGSATRIVDLRHGNGGASGSFTVATLRFVSGATPGPTSISIISLGLGFVDGNQPDQVLFAPLEITIGPSAGVAAQPTSLREPEAIR